MPGKTCHRLRGMDSRNDRGKERSTSLRGSHPPWHSSNHLEALLALWRFSRKINGFALSRRGKEVTDQP